MNDAASRFRRLEELFHRAKNAAGAARETLLADVALEDGPLVAEVRAMLAAHDTAAPLVEYEVIVDSLRTADLRPLPREQPAAIGGYRILRPLGEGGMGIVYEAEQRSPRRRVALKLVRPDLLLGGASEERIRRFSREVDALGRLEHPSIARVHEAGEATVETPTGTARIHYVAMELVEGKQLLADAAHRGLDLRQRIELMAQVCDAVAAAHAAGVIHRDLKPANILVTDAGQPKVLDFGIARIIRGPTPEPMTLQTNEGQLLGTVPYMSPEQFEGRSDAITARSDVYALGVVLFELLSGRLPLEIRTLPLADAARAVREQPPTRIGELAAECRGDLDTILTKALAKEPERRYADAAALADDLRRWLRHEPIRARPPSTLYQARTFVRRHRTLVAAMGLVVAVLVASSVVLSLFWYSEREQRAVAEAANRELAREAYHATMAAARAAVQSGEFLSAARELDAADEALRGWEWRFLSRQLAPVEASIPVHDRPIRSINITEDGGRAVAIDELGHGAVVDLATGEILWRFEAPRSADGHQIVLDRQGQRMLVRGGGRVLGFEIGVGERFRFDRDFTLSDYAITADGTTFVMTDLGGGALHRHSLLDGSTIGESRRDGVYGHAWWLADGGLLAWERSRGSTSLIERRDGEVSDGGAWRRSGRPSGHSASRSKGVLFDEDAIRSIDWGSGELLGSVPGPFAHEDSFSLNRRGDVIAISRAGDATDLVWLVPDSSGEGRPSRRVWGRAAAFSPTDDLLWTGAADGRLRAWRFDAPGLWALRPMLPALAAIAPDASVIASARWGTVRLRETRTGVQRWSVVAHRAEIFRLAWNGDGSRLATADERGWVRVLDPSNGATLASWKLGTRRITALEWLHDGRILALNGTATAPGDRYLLDPSTAAVPAAEADGGLVGPIVALPGRARTAIGTRDGAIAWYEAGAIGAPSLRSPTTEGFAIDWIVEDPGRGRLLAAAGRSLLVWSTDAGADPVARVAGSDLLRSRAAALSPDGQRLAVGDRAGSIMLFDGERLDLVVSLEVPSLDTLDCAWREDDALVVSGGAVALAALETRPDPQPALRARQAEHVQVAEALVQRHRTLDRALARVGELVAAGQVRDADSLVARLHEQGEDPNLLNSEAWKLCRNAEGALGVPTDADRERAALALSYATVADRLLPNDHAVMNTKALAEVRARVPEAALATLDRCDALALARTGRRDAHDVGIRAMALALRGDADAARAAAGEAERLAEGAPDADLSQFLAEVRSAITAGS